PASVTKEATPAETACLCPLERRTDSARQGVVLPLDGGTTAIVLPPASFAARDRPPRRFLLPPLQQGEHKADRGIRRSIRHRVVARRHDGVRSECRQFR